MDINYSTEYGANVLRRKIEEYWRGHGRSVNCRVEEVRPMRVKSHTDPFHTYVVRSDIGMFIPPASDITP